MSDDEPRQAALVKPRWPHLQRCVWGAWWLGTIAVVASWVDLVPPYIGWAGWLMTGVAVVVSIIVNRYWQPTV